MPDGGYTVDAEAMARAQVQLGEIVEDLENCAGRIAPPQVTQQNFGRGHGEHFGKYNAGMEQTCAALKGLPAEIRALGGGIGAASRRYAAVEQSATQTVNTRGGGL
jgi:hypothetical protein